MLYAIKEKNKKRTEQKIICFKDAMFCLKLCCVCVMQACILGLQPIFEHGGKRIFETGHDAKSGSV